MTRRPSWPNSGPVVSRPTLEQLPVPSKLMHSVRPTIWLAVMTPQSIVPEAVSGGTSFCAPSMRTPIWLYLSIRVWSMRSWRAPSTGE